MLKPSYPLLVLFLGFAIAVANRPGVGAIDSRSPVTDPGQESASDAGRLVTDNGGGDGNAVAAGDDVAHRWDGGAQAIVTIHGRVIDELGRPVADAVVDEARSGQTTSADEAGRFRLPAAEGRPAELSVEADGRSGSVEIAAANLPVTVVLRPARPWVVPAPSSTALLQGGRGLLKGGSGPLFVTVCETGVSVCADPTGNYQLPVPASPFHLYAYDGAGHVARSEEIAPPRKEQRWMPLPDLRLGPGWAVTGFVKRSGGDAAPGVDVLVRANGAVRRTRTGPGGGFEIDGLLPGRHVIELLPHDGEVGLSEEFDLLAELPSSLELSLRAEQPFECTVIDEQGEPRAGVHVVATESGYSWSSACSDAEGRVRIRGLGGRDLGFAAYCAAEGEGAGGATASAASAWRPLDVVSFDRAARQLVVR